MCKGWREGGRDIPLELHNRPPSFIKHMCEKLSKANEISETDVSVIDDQHFKVKSYEVYWGDENTRQSPHCQCRSFQRLHLPCKHMCAVMLRKHLLLTSLPSFYYNHVLLTVDESCINMTTVAPTESQPYDDAQFSSITNVLHDGQSDDIAPDANATKSTIQCGKQLRDTLHKIQNLSYIVDSADRLLRANNLLNEAYRTLLEACPQTGGLLLEAVGDMNAGKKNNFQKYFYVVNKIICN